MALRVPALWHVCMALSEIVAETYPFPWAGVRLWDLSDLGVLTLRKGT